MGENPQVIAVGELVTWQDHATAITESWQKTVLGILETGQRLLDAKKNLKFGDFGKMFEERAVPFADSTGRMLMIVAKHPVLANRHHGNVLPAHWRTLYELAALKQPDKRYRGWIADGTIHPEMERSDVTKLRRLCVRATKPSPDSPTCTTDDLHALVQAGKRFGTIYADPPWLYGNQGTRAATGNHYPGMTIEELMDPDVMPIASLIKEPAHLHLWTTNAFLFDAKLIMEAWGFEYKSCFVWVKPQMGIGNYWRVSHEFLLLGIKGTLSFADKSLTSWMECERTRHSAKPESIRHLVEHASPTPRLELFGRRVADGWTVWGNEIERTMFDAEVEAL